MRILVSTMEAFLPYSFMDIYKQISFVSEKIFDVRISLLSHK